MQHIGGYRLIATLGRGGMADVFLAVRGGDGDFHKLVVIKQLREDLDRDSDAATYRTLIRDEARLAARLRHPNIIQTFEVGDQDGRPFMAMEYIEGPSLSMIASRLARAKLTIPVEYTLRVVADLLDALDYVHELADYDGTPLGVVHRDVSPQNVLWSFDGEIKLLDFGVAKFALNTDATAAGTVKGKIAYMAPEQARGEPIDRRADVFAAGIVLWELLAGRRLMRRSTEAASLHRLLFEELPALSRIKPELSPAIVAICERALQRGRDQRYPTARAMREDLDRVLGGQRPRREELAAFIQPWFVEDRAVVAAQIREALSGRGSALITVADGEDERLPTALTVVEPSLPLRHPPSPGRSRRRGVLIGIAVAAGAVVGIDIALWQARLAPAPAPAALVRPAPATPPAAPALRLCGSNTIGAELAPALVEAFLAHKAGGVAKRTVSGERVELAIPFAGHELAVEIRAAGTATAFEGLLAGTCDLGMASRAISDKEVAALSAKGFGDLRSPATEHVIALDGIAVIVHPNNPLAAVDRAQLHDIFSGKLTDWAEVGGAPGPITVLARDRKSGTFDTFKHLVLGSDDVPAATRRFAQSDVLADVVASDPTSIGFIGLAYVRSAKALAIGDRGTPPSLPTSFTVTTEDYMLSRRLYLYSTPKPRTPLATELVGFALSPQGQAVVRATNFIDLDVALRDRVACDARCPASYAALIGRARRISLDFRFRSGSEQPDSRATRDLDRIVQFLRGYPDAKLLLLGFSDNDGESGANLKLSRQRADAIARELALRGVHATTVEGFGAAMPINSNASAADREQNRRVEAWLELAR